jgi:hypothetical protein
MMFKIVNQYGESKKVECHIVESSGGALACLMDVLFGETGSRDTFQGDDGDIRVYFKADICPWKYMKMGELPGGDLLMGGCKATYEINAPTVQQVEVVTIRPRPGQTAAFVRLDRGDCHYTAAVADLPSAALLVNTLQELAGVDGTPLVHPPILAGVKDTVMDIVDGFHHANPALAHLPSATCGSDTFPELGISVILVRG